MIDDRSEYADDPEYKSYADSDVGKLEYRLEKYMDSLSKVKEDVTRLKTLMTIYNYASYVIIGAIVLYLARYIVPLINFG